MFKKILYSNFTRNVYEKIKGYPFVKQLIVPLANRHSLNYLENTKNKLDRIGPGFCSAKWLQSTLHLEIGETHSCHHPKRHAVDFELLDANPGRLHNTLLKSKLRNEMLNGEKPSECEYCWRVEKTGDYSDRFYKSSASWASVDLEKLKSAEAVNNINPTYLEVSFSSECNLKCAYCYPEVSSSIRREIEKFGPYPTTDQFQNSEDYKKAISTRDQFTQGKDLSNHFWKWWDGGLCSDLRVLRVTGGEPLLSKDLFILMDRIAESKTRLDLDFSVNSNLMVGNDTIVKFISRAKDLVDQNKIKKFSLYTSIDTWGKHAEYLRFGLNTEKFVNNIETCLKILPDLELTFMVTYQALSPFNFNQLLEFILDLRKRFPKGSIKIGISNLLNPSFLSIQVLGPEFEKYIVSNLEFMKERKLSARTPHGFSQFEIQHLERILHGFKSFPSSWTAQGKNFQDYFREYDRRKNTSFQSVFGEIPELIKLV
ncbi:MAG: twitch domain-containing radical SAM protein [Bacteriovorax sp.]